MVIGRFANVEGRFPTNASAPPENSEQVEPANGRYDSMKEQPVGVGRDPIDHSVGHRPINETYEPPNPIPQFRSRPKLQQPQPPPTRRPGHPTLTKKLAQEARLEAPTNSRVTDSKKSN